VKVFHGPLVEPNVKGVDPENMIGLQDAISKLSQSDGVRLHYRRGGTLFVDPPQLFLAKVHSTLRQHGMRELFAKAAKKLLRKLLTL